jgi:hypothetical protein
MGLQAGEDTFERSNIQIAFGEGNDNLGLDRVEPMMAGPLRVLGFVVMAMTAMMALATVMRRKGKRPVWAWEHHVAGIGLDILGKFGMVRFPAEPVVAFRRMRSTTVVVSTSMALEESIIRPSHDSLSSRCGC